MDGIIVFAAGARGVAVIERLMSDGHSVAGIVMPGGRSPSPLIADLAKRTGCHLSAPENVNAPIFLDLLAHRGVELSVVAGFPTIFSQALIDLPVHGTINLHAGRLPAYRGGSPLQWQIINGEARAGISVIRMDAGIDTGPILGEESFDIPAGSDISDLQTLADQKFADLTSRCVTALAEGTAQERVQSGEAAYWHQRNEADGRIDFARMTARQVTDLVRAITRPYPGAFAFMGRQPVRFWRVSVAEIAMRGIPGRIVRLQGKGPYLMCKEGAILAEEFEVEDGEGRLRTGQRLM